MHAGKAVEHELYAMVEGDPEARHPRVSDGELAGTLLDQALEEWHHRAPGARHIAIAHNRKAGVLLAGKIVGGHEQLVGQQLGRTIQVDRAGRLVGGQCDDLLHAILDRRGDDVFGTIDVGADAFGGVVLGRGHMLERGGMNHIVDTAHGLAHALGITDIAQEIAHARRVETLLHLILFQLVAGEHHDAPWAVALKQPLDEAAPERSGPPEMKMDLSSNIPGS